MKAYLLAAGLGTRLRPLTDRTPKCLLEMGGEPLLGRWLAACRRHGIGEVLVNTHHLAAEVQRYVEGPARRYGIRVRLFHEPSLLGSAGTVMATRDFVAGEESFFILYADNLSEVDLGRMAAWHGRHLEALTLGLFRAPHPKRCGIAVLDAQARVIAFEEKPRQPRSPWAGAGVYVARQRLFACVEEAWQNRGGVVGTLDFGCHVLPLLAARREVCGYPIEEFLLDVGTPDAYEEARRRFSGCAAARGASPPRRAGEARR